MSDLEHYRLGGMASEGSPQKQSRATAAGKGRGTGRMGMAAHDDEARFEMNARAPKARVKDLPRVSTTADYGRRPLTPPVAWQTRGGWVPQPPQSSQRVGVSGTQKTVGITSTQSQFAASLESQARYIDDNRSIGADGSRPEVFTDEKDRVDPRAMVREWLDAGDKAASWHTVSPENGKDIADMRDYIRRHVSKLESDLLSQHEKANGHRLQWFAAIHRNTDHPHAHIVIRGRVDGRHMKIDMGYFNKGIRVRAREAATEVLGPRTEQQLKLTEEREKTPEYRQERLAQNISRRVLGWRLEARVNMRDLDAVNQLRHAIKGAGLHHKLDRETGHLIVHTSSHAATLATADAIAQDYASVLLTPHADVMKRGMQFESKIFGRFVTPETDERFADTGVAGIPLLKNDIERIRQMTGDREVAIDQAVMLANDSLTETYRRKLIARDAGPDEGLVTAGWVLNIVADHNVHRVANELTDMGVQHRFSRQLDADGTPAAVVVAYAGSMDRANEISDHISAKFGDEMTDLNRRNRDELYRFSPGIEGRFVPHADDRLMIDDRAGYQHGLPRINQLFSDVDRTLAAESFLKREYGEFFSGETNPSPAPSPSPQAKVPVAEVAKEQPDRTEIKPAGFER